MWVYCSLAVKRVGCSFGPQPTQPTTNISGSFQLPGLACGAGKFWEKPMLLKLSPGIFDVAGGTPKVAVYAAAPFPNITHSILTKTEYNVARLLFQAFAHQNIRFLLFRKAILIGTNFAVRTPVVFQVVDSPFGIS